MGKIISLSNQKGGVGKTTTAINLSAYVAHAGHKVLLIDMDPQGNATRGLGVENKEKLEYSCYELLMGDCNVADVILPVGIDGLSLLPCNMNLAAAEVDLVNMTSREYKLKNAIDTIKNQYDYIFIDCPPSLGLLTLNALTASDEVLIPIQSEFFALEGLSQLLNTVNLVKKRLNPTLAINGVVITMYDGRTLVSQQAIEYLHEHFGDKIYTIPVPRNVKLVESPSYGVPVLQHAPRSSGAVAYEALAKQFLQRG